VSLVILGFAMIVTFMVLIMTKKLTPVVALILVPTIFGLFAGAGLGLGDMVMESVGKLAPTAALLMFAIIYFGIMIDVGLFDPLVRFILKVAGNDPAKIVVGTALLAGAVSLDGDGSTTFIVTTAALLPIYLRLGMSPVVLTCVAGLANGTLNIVPWGGPTVRAAAALKVDASDIFVPMIPSLIAGLVIVFLFAWMLGLAERKRLGRFDADGSPLGTDGSLAGTTFGRARGTTDTTGTGSSSGVAASSPAASPATVDASGVAVITQPIATAMSDTMLDADRSTLRPKLIWFNLALTLAVMTLLVLDLVPLFYVFMIGSSWPPAC
jgi:CitMHS family citrate-Mg2+:H+ or citrate-Ca2+:H+ symporter